MSSRNAYLSPEERVQARCLSQAWKTGERNVARAAGTALNYWIKLKNNSGSKGQIDYIKIVDSTPSDVDIVDENSRMLMAVKIGNTRLIDNSALLA